MKTVLLVTLSTLLLSTLSSPTNDHYYTGFTETLGLDTHITNEGVDCTEPVSKALYHFRDELTRSNRNNDAFLHAVVEIIDKLKYEVSPLCRVFYGDFGQFMTSYFGDAEELRNTAERNLETYYDSIEGSIEESLSALDSGDHYEAGRVHGYLLKIFLDLEKNVAPPNVKKTVETVEEVMEDRGQDNTKTVVLDEIVEVSGYEEIYDDTKVMVDQDHMDEGITYDVVEVEGDEEERGEYSGVEVQRITETEELGEDVVGVFVEISRSYQGGDSGKEEEEEQHSDDYVEEQREEDKDDYLHDDYDYYLEPEDGVQVVQRRMLAMEHGYIPEYDYDL